MIKHELVLLLKEQVSQTQEAEPALIFAIEQLMESAALYGKRTSGNEQQEEAGSVISNVVI